MSLTDVHSRNGYRPNPCAEVAATCLDQNGEVFIPEERAGVKGGFGLQFCGGMAFAGHAAMPGKMREPASVRANTS